MLESPAPPQKKKKKKILIAPITGLLASHERLHIFELTRDSKKKHKSHSGDVLVKNEFAV